jgi:hypothetical protein
MKTYDIPIVFEVVKVYKIQGENLQDAVNNAVNTFLQEPCQDGNYIDDSYFIDHILNDNYPDEKWDDPYK